jgi:hypothetical protein
MATATQLEYRKQPQPASGNSTDSPFHLLARAEASNLHPRKRNVLVTMLQFNRFAKLDSENEIYAATLTVAVALGLPYITVRRAIDGLEKDGVLVLRYPENYPVPKGRGYEFRRPRTYQVNEEKLTPRMTVDEHRHRRFGEIRDRHKSRHSRRTTRPSPPAQEAANAAPPAANAAPVPVAVPIDAPAPLPLESRPEQRMRDRRQRLAAVMIQQIKAGASQVDALKIAAAASGFAYAEGEEQLKIMKFDSLVLSEVQPDTPGAAASKPERRRDANLAVNLKVKQRLRERFGDGDDEPEESP